jgi:hypothetical protein
MVPGWSVLDDEAKLLDTPFPQYLRWLKSPAGQWWMPRLRAKWRILAFVREREQDEHSDTAQDARWKAEGWHGGRTAPAGQVKRLA